MTPATARKPLAEWITLGLYAINPQSQRCKWIAIDADYDGAFFDLGKLKGELELDGVWAALAMSRPGGHFEILCEQPTTDNNAQKNGRQEKARMKKARGKKKTQQKLNGSARP